MPRLRFDLTEEAAREAAKCAVDADDDPSRTRILARAAEFGLHHVDYAYRQALGSMNILPARGKDKELSSDNDCDDRRGVPPRLDTTEEVDGDPHREDEQRRQRAPHARKFAHVMNEREEQATVGRTTGRSPSCRRAASRHVQIRVNQRCG